MYNHKNRAHFALSLQTTAWNHPDSLQYMFIALRKKHGLPGIFNDILSPFGLSFSQ
jgi:hypothetical protein